MIFTARRLQDNCQEQIVDLHMAFVDLNRACATVSCDGSGKIKVNSGCIIMVRQFYIGMQASVQND